MEFTLEGTIIEIANERNGVSQKTGKDWTALDLVVETREVYGDNKEFVDHVKFDCYGDITNAVKMRSVGDKCRLTFSPSAYEHKGSWFGKLNLRKIELIGNDSQSSHDPVDDVTVEQAQQAMNAKPQQTDMFDGGQDGDKDGLPF